MNKLIGYQLWHHKECRYRFTVFMFDYKKNENGTNNYDRPLYSMFGISWPYPTPQGYVDMPSPIHVMLCSIESGQQMFEKDELSAWLKDNGWEECGHAELRLCSPEGMKDERKLKEGDTVFCGGQRAEVVKDG